MNIFYLDSDPQKCAEMHCDKHVVKMIIEYAQLMSTAHRVLDGTEYYDLTANGRKIKRWRLGDDREQALMKASHVMHPSNIWTRSNRDNYNWLYRMWFHLLREYTHRYGKIHACGRLETALYVPPHKIVQSEFWPPTPAMPDDCKIANDSLASYHKYYTDRKVRFAKWTKRAPPIWYTDALNKTSCQHSNL